MSVITLSPTSAYRGNTVTVSGTGLKPNVKLILLADSIIDPYNSKFRASRSGTFTIGYVIPATATYGSHNLRIQSLASTNHWVNEGSLLTLTVLSIIQSVTTRTIISTAITQIIKPPTLPVAPTGLAASIGNQLVNLAWGVVSLANSYKIYMNNIAIGTSTSPAFSATGLTNGTTYTFAVSAVNAVGEGPRSSTISAVPGVSPPANLATAITNAPSGGTIIATGGTYSGNFTINKPLTIVGGTISFPTGTIGIHVTSNNVVFDGVTVQGSQYTNWAEDYAVYVDGSSGSPITGFIFKNGHIFSVGKAAIWATHVTGASVDNNVIEDCAYTGVTYFSAIGGSITGNTIRRIGYTIDPAQLPEGSDAYGINVNDQGTPCSSDVVVSGNTVEDVPTWHGLDTHGGLRISWINNTVRRVRRGLFITSSPASGAHATNNVITGNQLLSPDPIALATTPVTLATVYGAVLTNNTITGWGNGKTDTGKPWYDYLGQSTGLVDNGGNVVTP